MRKNLEQIVLNINGIAQKYSASKNEGDETCKKNQKRKHNSKDLKT